MRALAGLREPSVRSTGSETVDPLDSLEEPGNELARRGLDSVARFELDDSVGRRWSGALGQGIMGARNRAARSAGPKMEDSEVTGETPSIPEGLE